MSSSTLSPLGERPSFMSVNGSLPGFGDSHPLDSLLSLASDLWNNYLFWVLSPLALAFLLPLLTLLFIYVSALFLMLHKAKLVRRLKEAVLEEKDLFRAGREIICNLWDVQGRIWHGYTISGMENIPDKGPALIIYYHGALPVDYYYLVAKISLVKNRVLHCVVDSILFRIPGLSGVLQAFSCTPGTVSSCAQTLSEGNLLGLSPGGVYEAQFSSHRDYNIMWKERTGFAKVAIKAGPGIPIIPVFTRNVRETFRTAGLCKGLFMRLYNRFRLPLLPIYGNFPVKLHTFIGEPIDYDHERDSPEVIRDKCRAALQTLIEEHQVRPGSIVRALFERVKYHSQ